jgi:hypothetical protein
VYEKRAARLTARVLLLKPQFKNSGFQTYISETTLFTLAFYNSQFWLINL